MCLSTYRYLRNYITSLLLLLSAPIAWGRQEEATNNITRCPSTHQTDSITTLPQEGLYALKKPAITPLTAEQQQWLDSYLEKKDSDKKRFEKLLAVTGHEEAYVREAALQTAYQLLIDNPDFANKRAVKTLRKVPRKAKNADEARQALQLLYLLVETNPTLALSVSKVVVDRIEGSQLEQKGIGLRELLPLLSAWITYCGVSTKTLGMHKRSLYPSY